MTKSNTNFLGIPIVGEIFTGTRRVESRPREEFEELVRNVLADDLVVEFGWTQYTPYFNDGDVCEFGAGEIWVRTTSDLPEAEREVEEGVAEALSLNYSHPTLGEETHPNGWQQPAVYEGDHPNTFHLCQQLNKAVQGGQFDHLLLELFGDHAEVTVSRAGITVESYSHD
jgi:hypothetical protein